MNIFELFRGNYPTKLLIGRGYNTLKIHDKKDCGDIE